MRKRLCGVIGSPVLIGFGKKLLQYSGPDLGMKILFIPVILPLPRATLTAAGAKLRPRAQRPPQFSAAPADALGMQ